MIQKGIIEKTINDYQYRVRIPKYDKIASDAAGTKSSDLNVAITCINPGVKITYAVGDIVLVGYENDEISRPVILGLLARDIDTSSQISIPSVNEKINLLTENLDILQNKYNYSHIKYSNDNGLTFTSLYDPTSVYIINEDIAYHKADNIAIDPNSNVACWTISDSLGNIVTDNFNIETTFTVNTSSIVAENGNEVIKEKMITYTSTESLIKIPISVQHFDNLSISFKIADIVDFDSYHIVLTTDKNVLGSTYGDYVGLYIGNSSEPPLHTSEYVWLTFKNIMDYYIGVSQDMLLARIERNEEALYGFNYSNGVEDSDGSGLLDAISVNNIAIQLHGTPDRNIYFNSARTIFIDNKRSSLTTSDLSFINNNVSDNGFKMYYRDNGHFSIVKI